MKKLFAIIVVCGMLLGTAMPIAAADGLSAIQPRYTYVMDVSAGIEVSTLGVATCNGLLTTKTNNPVKLVIRLQEHDGSNWMTIKKMEFTDTGDISAAMDYAIYSGYSYRVHVTGYVYDAQGNVLESATAAQYMDY